MLAPDAADALHPAFSNLFVQTEILDKRHAILCTRRPRSREENVPWMFHRMAVHGPADGGRVSYETDRSRFIGRGRTLAPLAMGKRRFRNQQGSCGTSRDPLFVTLEQESATIDMVSPGPIRGRGLALVRKYETSIWRTVSPSRLDP